MYFIDVLPLCLLQAAAENTPAMTDPLLKLLLSIAGGSPVAAVLALFLWKEWQRRDTADKANLAEHGKTQGKVDEVREGYHGLREELVRKQLINGKGA